MIYSYVFTFLNAIENIVGEEINWYSDTCADK